MNINIKTHTCRTYVWIKCQEKKNENNFIVYNELVKETSKYIYIYYSIRIDLFLKKITLISSKCKTLTRSGANVTTKIIIIITTTTKVNEQLFFYNKLYFIWCSSCSFPILTINVNDYHTENNWTSLD